MGTINFNDEQDVYARTEFITVEKAKEYLAMNKKNRPLNKARVEEYASQIRKGQWKQNGQTISFNKQGILQDGQHRLQAVIETDTPTKMLVAYNCDDDGFPTIDTGKSRVFSDVLSLEGTRNYRDVSAIVSRYVGLHFGLSVINANNISHASVKKIKKISNQDLLEEYTQSKDLYNKAYSLAKSCNDKLKLMKISEIGGLYVFLVKDKYHNESTVTSFFRMLFH